MEWYLKVLRQYADFNGRARRKEFWMFALFNFLAATVITMIDYAIFGIEGGGILSAIYSLGVLIPGLAVGVRRMHDIGKSGWWLLIVLVPLIGGILFIVWAATDSQVGTNEYGVNPKSA